MPIVGCRSRRTGRRGVRDLRGRVEPWRGLRNLGVDFLSLWALGTLGALGEKEKHRLGWMHLSLLLALGAERKWPNNFHLRQIIRNLTEDMADSIAQKPSIVLYGYCGGV